MKTFAVLTLLFIHTSIVDKMIEAMTNLSTVGITGWILGIILSNLLFVYLLKKFMSLGAINFIFIISFLFNLSYGIFHILFGRSRISTHFVTFYLEIFFANIFFFYSFNKYTSASAFKKHFHFKCLTSLNITFFLSILTYGLLLSLTNHDQLLDMGMEYKENIGYAVNGSFAICLFLYLKQYSNLEEKNNSLY